MTRRSGLGRGLDALLPVEPADASRERDGALLVAVDDIEPNRNQPRRDFDDAALQELSASIRQLGILQPLLVRPSAGGRYELVAGERRWRAARRAGLERVPVMVVETDDQGSLERALVENVHRADLRPLEEAAAYRELLDRSGSTQEELGRRLGRNRVTIANAIRLLELPVGIQKYLNEGRITAAHGRALLGLQGNPFQERLARRVAQEGLSVRETEDAVRKYQTMAGAVAGTRSNAERAVLTDVQRRLADHLQTRVRVEMGKKKGKIVLDFVSLEELERLIAIIMGTERGATLRSVAPD